MDGSWFHHHRHMLCALALFSEPLALLNGQCSVLVYLKFYCFLHLSQVKHNFSDMKSLVVYQLILKNIWSAWVCS